jgi:two-component system, NarL family, response regulator YdfI
MTRVLIASISPVVRAGLEALLSSNESLEVIGLSDDLGSLAQQIHEKDPDVVLLEFDRREDEAASMWESSERDPAAFVVLTDEWNSPWAIEAMKAGVRAILSREASAEEILAAVMAASAGLVVLHPDAMGALLSDAPGQARLVPEPGLDPLTPRETEVLGMIAEGLGNKTIAYRLGISEHTVKFHVASIFSKLNASSRTEAVTLGIRQGLIMI